MKSHLKLTVVKYVLAFMINFGVGIKEFCLENVVIVELFMPICGSLI